MYKIIGGDQKEYGPVSYDQLVGWVRDCRANGQTLVQKEGGPWLPLGSLPEFQTILPPAGNGAGQPPVSQPGVAFPMAPMGPGPGAGGGGGGGFGGGGAGGGGYGYPGGNESRARDLVSGPATALIVTGIVGAVIVLIGLAFGMFGSAFQAPTEGLPPELRPLFEALEKMQSPVMLIVDAVIKLAVSGLIIFGGMRMRALTGFALVVTGSVLAIIPCTSPCCCIGLPVGIWALVVLFKPEVKSAFR